VLHNPTDLASVAQLAVVERSLRERGKEFMVVPLTAADQFAPAFSNLAAWRADTVVILENSLTVRNRQALIELAARNRWPTINSWIGFAEAGGVISYGSSWGDAARRSAGHVDKILKGAKPADLPVERASKFELVVNLKAAKALGLSIPAAVLLRADRVIE
jgi:putative ABC transport system substrate-binding protein